MTLAPEAPTRTNDVQFRFDAAGRPLAIRHDGRIWLVDPATESRHWSGCDASRDTRPAAAADSGDLAGVEYWRVQVFGSNSALRTFTLRRNPIAAHWLLESIDDGC